MKTLTRYVGRDVLFATLAVFAALLVDEALQAYHGVGFLLVAGGAIVSCLPADRVLSSRAPPRG